MSGVAASLVEELQSSRAAVHEAVAGLDERAGAAKVEGGWSVKDCLEHLAIAERGMLRMIAERASRGDSADRIAEEQWIREYGKTRDKPTQAPSGALPTGRYATVEAALGRFDEARERTIAYVAEYAEELRGRLLEHPLRGRITAHECVLLMVHHSLRHTAQIRELLAR